MIFPLARPARLAVFASGRGSNLSSLLRAFPSDDSLAAVTLLVSNNENAGALEIAAAAEIPTRTSPFPSRKRDPQGRARAAFEEVAEDWLTQAGTDLICLAGFMRIFSAEFNARWHGRILNIHPSLLPDFPGLHPQRQALAAGVREAGCTVHFVDAGVDTGETILQRRVPVWPGDTEAALAARILQEEHIAYPEAVRLVLSGQVTPGRASATRSPATHASATKVSA